MVARGKHCEVVTPSGRLSCVLRGLIKKEKLAEVDPVAVGDWVEVTPESPTAGVIESIEPRVTKFSRPAPGRPNVEQVIVSNATHLVVCQSARQPFGQVSRSFVISGMTVMYTRSWGLTPRASKFVPGTRNLV